MPACYSFAICSHAVVFLVVLFDDLIHHRSGFTKRYALYVPGRGILGFDLERLRRKCGCVGPWEVARWTGRAVCDDARLWESGINIECLRSNQNDESCVSVFVRKTGSVWGRELRWIDAVRAANARLRAFYGYSRVHA